MNSIINLHFNEVSEAMTLLDREEIIKVVEVLKMVRKMGKTAYICGNGGSAALSSHFANDLIKMAHVKAHAVGDEGPVVTAYGNDSGWENMFSHAIRERIVEGDCVFGISCSGMSENVVAALDMSQEKGGFAIGLTGNNLKSVMSLMELDGLVHVPYPDIRVQEDVHTMVCHAIARQLQNER